MANKKTKDEEIAFLKRMISASTADRLATAYQAKNGGVPSKKQLNAMVAATIDVDAEAEKLYRKHNSHRAEYGKLALLITPNLGGITFAMTQIWPLSKPGALVISAIFLVNVTALVIFAVVALARKD